MVKFDSKMEWCVQQKGDDDVKRFLSLALLTLVTLLCSCNAKQLKPVGSGTVSDNATSSFLNTSKVSDSKYSVERQELIGVWKLCYYSYDNEVYKDYAKDISAVGSYSFYADGTALIKHSESDEQNYRYFISEENKGNIILYEAVSGEPAPFFFGYGIMDSEAGKILIISKYNSSEETICYYILRKIF